MMRAGSARQTKGLGFGCLHDVAVDGSLKIDDGVEHTVLQPPAGQLGEEAFNSIEPRARGRREVKGVAVMAIEPGANLGVLVSGIVVEDHVDDLAGGDLALEGVEEADEFLMPMALHVPADHGAVEDVQRTEQGEVVPLRLQSWVKRCATPLLHRQPRLCPVERLDLRLLVDAQHDRVLGRVEIKPDNLVELLPRMADRCGELESAEAMQGEGRARTRMYSALSRRRAGPPWPWPGRSSARRLRAAAAPGSA